MANSCKAEWKQPGTSHFVNGISNFVNNNQCQRVFTWHAHTRSHPHKMPCEKLFFIVFQVIAIIIIIIMVLGTVYHHIKAKPPHDAVRHVKSQQISIHFRIELSKKSTWILSISIIETTVFPFVFIRTLLSRFEMNAFDLKIITVCRFKWIISPLGKLYILSVTRRQRRRFGMPKPWNVTPLLQL